MSKCKECQFAEWERTPTGRIKRLVHGTCSATIPDLKALVPACVELKVWRRPVWPSDIGNCLSFKPAAKATGSKA